MTGRGRAAHGNLAACSWCAARAPPAAQLPGQPHLNPRCLPAIALRCCLQAGRGLVCGRCACSRVWRPQELLLDALCVLMRNQWQLQSRQGWQQPLLPLFPAAVRCASADDRYWSSAGCCTAAGCSLCHALCFDCMNTQTSMHASSWVISQCSSNEQARLVPSNAQGGCWQCAQGGWWQLSLRWQHSRQVGNVRAAGGWHSDRVHQQVGLSGRAQGPVVVSVVTMASQGMRPLPSSVAPPAQLLKNVRNHRIAHIINQMHGQAQQELPPAVEVTQLLDSVFVPPCQRVATAATSTQLHRLLNRQTDHTRRSGAHSNVSCQDCPSQDGRILGSRE